MAALYFSMVTHTVYQQQPLIRITGYCSMYYCHLILLLLIIVQYYYCYAILLLFYLKNILYSFTLYFIRYFILLHLYVFSDDTQDNTFMLLVNAIYFKGQWEKPFPESATKPNSFNLLSGDKVQTQYMSVIDKFNYAELPELDCKVIRLPYVVSFESFSSFLFHFIYFLIIS